MQMTKTFDIELTPEQVAGLFCDMHAGDQAKFFNEVGRLSKGWTTYGIEIQMAWVKDNEILNNDGKEVMGVIGCA